MKAKYKWLLWFAGIVLLVVIVSSAYVYICLNSSYDESEEDQQKFNKAKWRKSANELVENDRHYMLTDLKENYLKLSTDSINIKKTLGEPDSRGLGFAYNLGLCKPSIDPTFLILTFDKNGKLIKIDKQTI